MIRDYIKTFVEKGAKADGVTETGISGVQLFRATQAVPCAPAVYEPCIVAIVSGSKEAILEGRQYVYDSSQYMCCPTSLPVKAGTPTASEENPLYGVLISLDPRIMTELAIEMDSFGSAAHVPRSPTRERGIKLATWDNDFSDALLRLLRLSENELDTAVLAEARLRELYYAILKGEAGTFARQSFGAGNAITRSIAHLSTHLTDSISIDEMAARAGMSRAVFHRKFKEATMMSPIQFVKSMRLNNAAMKIASGISVNEAALDVGYVSASQFSREFKRMYGQSPRHWSDGLSRPQLMS